MEEDYSDPHIERSKKLMPWRIKHVLTQGSCTISDDEWFEDYQDVLLAEAKNLAIELKLGYVPIDFDDRSNTFIVSDRFASIVTEEAYDRFEETFVERFDSVYGATPELAEDDIDTATRNALLKLDDDDNPIFPDADLSGVPFLIDDLDYANHALDEFLKFPIRENPDTDPYGWNPMRKSYLMQNLAAYIAQYQLPRFVVKFADDGSLSFQAGAGEIEDFYDLMARRAMEYEADVETIRAQFPYVTDEIILLVDMGDATSDEEQQVGEMNAALEDSLIGYQDDWTLDNNEYTFPSSIMSYTHEVAWDFKLGQDMTGAHQDKIGLMDRANLWKRKQLGPILQRKKADDEAVKSGKYWSDAKGKKIVVNFNKLPGIEFN